MMHLEYEEYSNFFDVRKPRVTSPFWWPARAVIWMMGKTPGIQLAKKYRFVYNLRAVIWLFLLIGMPILVVLSLRLYFETWSTELLLSSVVIGVTIAMAHLWYLTGAPRYIEESQSAEETSA